MQAPDDVSRAISSGAHDRATVLIAEDDANMRELVVSVLEDLTVDLVAVENAQHALDYLESHEVALVITDLRMPGVDGMEVLRFAKSHDPMTQVLVLTGHATVESAIQALKIGAYDYVCKPFDNVELHCTVERALEHYELGRENQRLRAQNRIYTEGNTLIGRSQAMESVCRLIDSAATYDCSVLITAQSGCGKELVARQIHSQSKRKERPFVAINCAAIPESLIESELFGHRKGAFTGADRSKPGLFQAADGGTIFLDEINNASPSLQAKLLRVLQDGSFYSMGDTELQQVNVRVLAASNRSIAELIENGEFREDLFYRLKVMEIVIPPLCERRDDIPLLAHYFLNKFSRLYQKDVKGMTTQVLGSLLRYEWPGNVRELENLVQRMIILTEQDMIDVDVLPPELNSEKLVQGRALDYIPPQSLDEIEAYFIQKTLRETEGNRALSAEILGIDKSTLWRKIKRYGLDG